MIQHETKSPELFVSFLVASQPRCNRFGSRPTFAFTNRNMIQYRSKIGLIVGTCFFVVLLKGLRKYEN